MILLEFAKDFAIFTMWLQTYGLADGQTDGQNDGQTDKIMGGQTNEWMDMHCMCIDMQNTIIFQQILQFLQEHYIRTDGRTDGWTNGQTEGRTNGWTNPIIEIRQPHLKNKCNFCDF